MTDSSAPVILVGAGIGGLFAALCLQQKGIDPVLLEKSHELAEVGAGIQIGANGSRLIAKLGLQDEIEKYATSPDSGQVMHGQSGRSLCTYPLNRSSISRYQLPYYQIHRADLQRVLVKAVEKRLAGSLRLGVELAKITQDANGIQAISSSGETIEGRVLVGCDGIHSRTRQLLIDDGAPVFTGCNAWRATVPAAALVGQKDPLVPKIWVGAGKHLVQYPVQSGAAVNIVACVQEHKTEVERWAGTSSTDELTECFADWCPQVRALLELAGDALRWGLYERPVLNNWNVGRATLLGDSAHAMLPSLAQGAVMAMEDADELAISLAAQADIKLALEDYQSKRIQRTRRVQQVARKNMSFFHQSSSLHKLSAGALGAAGPAAESIIANRYRWLYGYSGAASKDSSA
jgi:salicylate hydroxylase